MAFDYPGYGDSDPAPEDATRDDYAAAILAAMDALGVEEPTSAACRSAGSLQSPFITPRPSAARR